LYKVKLAEPTEISELMSAADYAKYAGDE